MFLDINMPEFDGFGVLDRLAAEEQPKAVVFVTAYDEHAIKAFEASALDYLLKPVSMERLRKALDRVRQKLALLAATRQPPPPPIRFAIRTGNRVTFIDSDQIDWIEADGNYAILHVGDTQHLLRETMSKLDKRLPSTAFLRVSRSVIIRLDRVAEIRVSADSRRNVILTGSRIAIPITRPWREISEAFQI